MQTYKLHTALTGVLRNDAGQMKVITIPVGSEIRVATITLPAGILNATWDGKAVSVFVQDLMARGNLVKTAEG